MAIRIDEAWQEIRQDLGYTQLNKIWARIEVFFGLFAMALGIAWIVNENQWIAFSPFNGTGIALFILGGYLALAGHRSHIYQSMNQQTAYLLTKLRHNNNQNDRKVENS